MELTIVGIRYYMPGKTDDEKKTAAKAFLASLPIGTRFILTKRPDNPYNPDAVASVLESDGKHCGYVNDPLLELITPHLDKYGQCEATLSNYDGHITYRVEVNVAKEDIPIYNPNAERVLTKCPLPHKFMFESQPSELKMDVFPMRFVNTEINAETLPDLYQKAQILLDCFNSSLCRNDAYWQNAIYGKIQEVHTYVRKQFAEDEETACNHPKEWCKLSDRCHDLIGDYYRCEGHGTIIERQFSHLVNSPEADELVEKLNRQYQHETATLLKEMSVWIKENLNVVFTTHLDWQELGHTIAYKKMSRAETYEILTVLVLLHKKRDHAAATKGATKKKSTSDKEHGIARDTFSCAGHITVPYLDVLLQDMIQDKWLSNRTSQPEFRELFSGKASACEIVWTGEVGLGSLKKLFSTMKKEGFIKLPAGARSVNSVLENHVVDTQGHFITGLNSSSEAAGKSLQTIQKYISLLKTRVQKDDFDKMFSDLEQTDPSHY